MIEANRPEACRKAPVRRCEAIVEGLGSIRDPDLTRSPKEDDIVVVHASNSFLSKPIFRSDTGVLAIPLLLTNDEDPARIRTEVHCARRYSQLWPVAVVHFPSFTSVKDRVHDFLTSVGCLNAQLLDTRRNDAVDRSLAERIVQILTTMSTRDHLSRAFLAKYGMALSEGRSEVERRQKVLWSKMYRAWAGIVKACNALRSSESEFDWMRSGCSEVARELKGLMKKRVASASGTYEIALESMEKCLPVGLTVVTGMGGDSFVSDNAVFHAELLTPHQYALGCSTAKENKALLFLTHGNCALSLPCSDACPREDVEFREACHSPCDGEVSWIGPETVAITQKMSKRSRLVICSVPGTEPLSHLAVGDSVKERQIILQGEVANSPSKDVDEPAHDPGGDRRLRSILRSMCIRKAIHPNHVNRFIGDLVCMDSIEPMSSEALVRLSVPESEKGIWQNFPLRSRKSVLHRQGMTLMAFRNNVLQPGWTAIKSTLNDLYENDRKNAKKAYDTYREKSQSHRRDLPMFAEKEVAAIETCKQLFEAAQKLTDSYDEIITAPDGSCADLEELRQAICSVKSERNPTPFPEKYNVVHDALRKVDLSYGKGRKLLQHLVDYIHGLEKVTGLSPSNFEMPEDGYFTEIYWNKGIMLFPEKCGVHWKPSIFSTFSSERGDIITSECVKIENSLREETHNWTKYQNLDDVLQQCKNANQRISEKLKEKFDAAKTTQEEVERKRQELNELKEDYEHSCDLFSKTLDVMKAYLLARADDHE